MFHKLLVLVLVAGVLAGFASVGSALFTSTASIAANSFSTGTVAISTNPSTAAITFSNMAPADEVTEPIVVSNDGTLDLRYAITASTTDTDTKSLMSQLVLTIKSGVTDCSNSGFGTSGLQLYTGELGSGAVGNPLEGADEGDRTLAPSANETLCFNVALPVDTGNAFQGATTTATFTFDAEQTANNN